MRFLFAAGLVLLLAACGAREVAYPPEAELNFRNACQARTPTPGFCGCVWQRIQAEVPAVDFIEYERLPVNERAAHPLTQQITEMSLACAAEVSPEPITEPPPAP